MALVHTGFFLCGKRPAHCSVSWSVICFQTNLSGWCQLSPRHKDLTILTYIITVIRKCSPNLFPILRKDLKNFSLAVAQFSSPTICASRAGSIFDNGVFTKLWKQKSGSFILHMPQQHEPLPVALAFVRPQPAHLCALPSISSSWVPVITGTGHSTLARHLPTEAHFS